MIRIVTAFCWLIFLLTLDKPFVDLMFRFNYISIFSFLTFIALSSFCIKDGKPDRKYKTKHVIVLVIDGPRYSETFGDTSCQYIPFMGKEMVKEGVLYTNFKNKGNTYTISGHTSITTGVNQSINNSGKTLPRKPSYFQYYLKQRGLDKSRAWIIASKGKLEVLSNTKDKKYKNSFMPSTYCGPYGNGTGYGSDVKTWEKVKEVLKTDKPDLMLINLLAVDVHGHANDWDGYLESIQESDIYAHELWAMIQRDPELKDQTTLFITNDHGRHLDHKKDGFVSHGDRCYGCRHISLLAMGPDFKKNVVCNKSADLRDISETIAELMHFIIPTARGRILEELFLD